MSAPVPNPDVVSDELVELAMLRAYAADPTVSYVSPGAVRAAIEAVLPDIERPWREKVQKIAEMNVRQQKLLVERDREIERLQASVNEQLARANERTVAAEAQLAACQFSDAERKALLRDPLLLNAEIRRLDLVILKRDREIDRLQAELDEEVAHWKRQLAAMDEAAAELRSHRDELKAQLAERDREIERLTEAKPGSATYKFRSEAERGRHTIERLQSQLATRQFSDVERRLLLGLLDSGCALGFQTSLSARVKLEQGQ